MKILTELQLNHIYDILVKYCGTDSDEYYREDFVYEHLKEDFPSELRICPKLGFGGKFWRANGRIYVSFYPEDETLLGDRGRLKKIVDEELKNLIELTNLLNEKCMKINCTFACTS